MRKKFLKSLAVICGIIMLFSGCGVSDIDFSDEDAAKKALNSAFNVYIEGNLANPCQSGNILADGQVAGYMKETGILDIKWTVSIGKNTWFYVKFVTDEPINNVEGVITGTTYGYYDSNDNCLGYAQKRYIETVYGTDYYMVFLDAEGNPKGYYSDEYGKVMYDYDGNIIAFGSADKNGILTDKCHVEIDMEQSDKQVDFMDKMIMYIKLFYNLESIYLD